MPGLCPQLGGGTVRISRVFHQGALGTWGHSLSISKSLEISFELTLGDGGNLYNPL